MEQLKCKKKNKLYCKKVKTVYSTDNFNLLALEFRNDISALDSKHIKQLKNNGMINNKFNHFYEKTSRSRHSNTNGAITIRY